MLCGFPVDCPRIRGGSGKKSIPQRVRLYQIKMLELARRVVKLVSKCIKFDLSRILSFSCVIHYMSVRKVGCGCLYVQLYFPIRTPCMTKLGVVPPSLGIFPRNKILPDIISQYRLTSSSTLRLPSNRDFLCY